MEHLNGSRIVASHPLAEGLAKITEAARGATGLW